MRKRSDSRVFLAIGLIAIVVVVTQTTTADGNAATAVPIPSSTGVVSGVDDGPFQPDWDVGAIKQCAYNCAFSFDFNVCFTCRCLVAGAQTEGEVVSALAQCSQATSYLD